MKHFLAVLLFSSFIVFFNLGGRTLENKDYLRYAEVGREIIETGDWVMLHENGVVYVQKPPLHFWKIAASQKAFGINPFSSRLPSAIFAIIGTIVTFIFALRTSKRSDVSLLSSLILLSSYGFFFFSRRTRIDIEFSVLFSLSLILFYFGYTEGKNRFTLFALFWITTGLLFMDKGPAAFLNLVPVASYIPLSSKKNRLKNVSSLLLAFPAFLIPVVPWIIKLVSHREFHQYISALEKTRIMTRREGIFYYIPQVIEKFAPGVLFLPASLYTLKKEKLLRKDPVFFLLIWTISYFITINLTHVKNHRYLLPIFIPLSILTSWGICEAMEKRYFESFFKMVWKVFAVLYLLCFVASPLVAHIIFGRTPKNIIALSFLSLGFILLLWARKEKVLIPFVGASFLYVHMDLMDTLRNHITSDGKRAYTALIEKGITSPECVCFLGPCQSREREVLSFYLNRLITCTNSINEAKKFKVIITSGDIGKNIEKKLTGRKIVVENHEHKHNRDIYIFFLWEGNP